MNFVPISIAITNNRTLRYYYYITVLVLYVCQAEVACCNFLLFLMRRFEDTVRGSASSPKSVFFVFGARFTHCKTRLIIHLSIGDPLWQKVRAVAAAAAAAALFGCCCHDAARGFDVVVSRKMCLLPSVQADITRCKSNYLVEFYCRRKLLAADICLPWMRRRNTGVRCSRLER